MSLSLTHKVAFIGIIVLILTVLIAFGFGEFNIAYGSAPPGSKTTVATTSPMAVGTSAARAFATSTCDTRVITTYASPIMMTFSDAQGAVPTALFGILQPASTTVAYDSGQYGCDAVRIYSFVAQTITLQEAR